MLGGSSEGGIVCLYDHYTLYICVSCQRINIIFLKLGFKYETDSSIHYTYLLWNVPSRFAKPPGVYKLSIPFGCLWP